MSRNLPIYTKAVVEVEDDLYYVVAEGHTVFNLLHSCQIFRLSDNEYYTLIDAPPGVYQEAIAEIEWAYLTAINNRKQAA